MREKFYFVNVNLFYVLSNIDSEIVTLYEVIFEAIGVFALDSSREDDFFLVFHSIK